MHEGVHEVLFWFGDEANTLAKKKNAIGLQLSKVPGFSTYRGN